jgi:hypothetical protein
LSGRWVDRENKILGNARYGFDLEDNEWNYTVAPITNETSSGWGGVSVDGVPWMWYPVDGGQFGFGGGTGTGYDLFPTINADVTPIVWYKYYRTSRQAITTLTRETLVGLKLVDRQLLDVREKLEDHFDEYGQTGRLSSGNYGYRQFNPGYYPDENAYDHAMSNTDFGIPLSETGTDWKREYNLIGGNPYYDIDIGEVWYLSNLIGPFDYTLKLIGG